MAACPRRPRGHGVHVCRGHGTLPRRRAATAACVLGACVGSRPRRGLGPAMAKNTHACMCPGGALAVRRRWIAWQRRVVRVCDQSAARQGPCRCGAVRQGRAQATAVCVGCVRVLAPGDRARAKPGEEAARRPGRQGHRLDEKKTAWVDCSPSGSPPGVRLVQGGAGAGRVIEAGA